MFRPGPEMVVALLVVLIFIFGAKRMPELGASLGKGLRAFKTGIMGGADDDTEREAITRNDS